MFGLIGAVRCATVVEALRATRGFMAEIEAVGLGEESELGEGHPA